MVGKSALNILLVFVSIFLISCRTQIPVGNNYPYTEQQKMQAAHHWEVLAEEVVDQLYDHNSISKETALVVYPKFHVQDREDPVIWTTTTPLTAADESNRVATIPFKRAYQNYLNSKLVEAGYNVVDDSRLAELIMAFDVQLVKQADRAVRRPTFIKQLVRLFTGGYRGVKAGSWEVVITTSVKSEHKYLMCHTDTYYVNSPPWDENYSMPGKVMEVVDK